MNKITNYHDTDVDTLDNRTDTELDQVIGSDCGGNSLRIRGDFKEEGGPLTNISILYSSIPLNKIMNK